MRAIFSILTVMTVTTFLTACSSEDAANQDAPLLISEISESAWLRECGNTSAMDNRNCTNRQVLWVLTLSEELESDHDHLIAQLGPRDNGLRAEIELLAPAGSFDQELRNRTFFLRGIATADLTFGRRPMVRIREAEIVGFQTTTEGPKQGPYATDLTLTEFGRFCLLAPQNIYLNQCAGRRVVWYGFLRGAANDGVILGLPFDDASIARVKTTDPLTWPIGETRQLRDEPIVIEGILDQSMARQENGDRVPIILNAHVINFPRREEPPVEITGVE